MADDVPLPSASNRQFGSFQTASILPGYGVPPSVYPTDSVKDAAEALGITNLKESVAAALASDVECRIRELVQDASKYMRHAKRDQLKTTDIDLAMRAKNIEPLYGFLPTSSGRSAPSATFYPSAAGPSFRRAQTATGIVHYLEDDEIDFEKVLKAGPKLKPGKGVGWAAHWLAIEGVQPAIPQNPLPPGTTTSSTTTTAQGQEGERTSSDAATTAPAASAPRSLTGGAMAPLAVAGGKPGQAQVKPLIKHVLSRELQLYYERLTQAILSPPESADELEEDEEEEANGEGTTTSTQAKDKQDADGDIPMSGNAPTTSTPAVQPSTPKLLSNNTVRSAALASLKGDPGLHQLVPYLVQWIAESVTNHLRNTHVLGIMLLVSNALCENETIFIEPYLHQLLPSILSILLTSTLGNTTSSQTAAASASGTSNKVISGPSPPTLRAHSASLLFHLLKTYSPAYPNLKQRVVRTLLKALDAGCGRKVKDGSTSGNGQGEEERGQKGHGHGQGQGPRESPGTKLGAIIGLRSIGAGSTALLLQPDRPLASREGGDRGEGEEVDAGREREESEAPFGTLTQDRTPLGRLGAWCERWEKTKGRDELGLIDAEVGRALEALGRERGVGEGVLKEEEEGEVKEKFGRYWDLRIGRVGYHARAREVLRRTRI